MSNEVSQQTDPNRFEITVDGTPAGFTEFVDVDGDRVFFHTEIGEAYGGQGLAGQVVSAALEATKAAGLSIVPICKFVKGYVEKHPEWQAHVVAPTQAHVDAARAAA